MDRFAHQKYNPVGRHAKALTQCVHRVAALSVMIGRETISYGAVYLNVFLLDGFRPTLTLRAVKVWAGGDRPITTL